MWFQYRRFPLKLIVIAFIVSAIVANLMMATGNAGQVGGFPIWLPGLVVVLIILGKSQHGCSRLRDQQMYLNDDAGYLEKPKHDMQSAPKRKNSIHLGDDGELIDDQHAEVDDDTSQYHQ